MVGYPSDRLSSCSDLHEIFVQIRLLEYDDWTPQISNYDNSIRRTDLHKATRRPNERSGGIFGVAQLYCQ